MRIRQYCYFCLRSTDVPAKDMTARLGIEPDEVLVRGSKQGGPRMIPVQHQWSVVCREAGLDASEQIDIVLSRLIPEADTITQYLDELRQSGCHVTATLQVVRYLDDDQGEDEKLTDVTKDGRHLIKLSGNTSCWGGTSTIGPWISCSALMRNSTSTSTADLWARGPTIGREPDSGC